ncbi:echinoderm microtubule-associated protein-like 1 [Eurytemora carolleeae]|uniref:echinoderm microtubule-associated protein-like 1 n=1 Tax=Eurytemora carolleeae TaxID=1294199 RepID=UPI000C76C39A|nr:echinoderm microtubule-associated protein-like 1 [Eurytemora carolleeae]|eukprot:XP_023324259.1 echinoderm microtubule-associated protein-like 1 [Eurytemora affinis]
MNIWSIEGDILMRRQGLFTKKIDRPKYVICVAFAASGEILTGDSEGNIMVWRSVKVTRVLKGAHTGPVSDICVLEDGSFISGGVSDGTLCIFNSTYELIGVGATLPDQFGGVRRILKKSFKKIEETRTIHLIIGTTTNSIVEGMLRVVEGNTEVQDWEVDRVVLGHYQEVWGLAAHPTRDMFMTAGYDGNVILWDAVAHVDRWVVQISGQARCVDISPNGEVYAVGTLGGVLHVGLMETKEHMIMKHDEGLNTLKFSPSGEYLAVGSHDMKIHVYKLGEKGIEDISKISECVGHSSYIRFLDWSANSLYIRSVSGDYELLFWNPTTGDQVLDLEIMANIDWISQSCSISFETLGIWYDRSADGTDINCCAKSNQPDLPAILAVGDDMGKVKLYKYPAVQYKTGYIDLIGHSAHVTNVVFPLNRGLVSTGGRENSIIQWDL